MKKQQKLIFISGCILLLIFILHSTSISAQELEVEDEREFDYLEGSGKGPRYWGDIKKEWAACKNGEMQSPIDLSSERVKIMASSGNLKRKYKPANASVYNRGHDIQVQWDGTPGPAGSIKINGSDYFLHQCHWHSPAEHSINGRRYDMELHMVHVNLLNVNNRIAVVGQFYKIGQPDPFLAKLMGHIKSMTDSKGGKYMGVIDAREIKMGGKKYYRYMGSLTVPPCTEGVFWTINKKVRTVSREQVSLLREAVHDYAEQNARPLQPLKQREIHFYGPADDMLN